MSEMLLINPRGRRKARKVRKNPTPAQRAARAAFAARFGGKKRAAGATKRRRNPIGATVRRKMRSYGARRRRNPIGGLPSFALIIKSMKEAAIMGGGAVAVDMVYKRIETMLPVNLQRDPTKLDVGDGVKAIVTVALGQLLNGPTRGLSMRAATGALVVQAHGIVNQLLPIEMRLSNAGTLGYAVAAPVYDGEARVNPSLLEAYTNSAGPLLNEYTPAFEDSPLLDGASEDEGWMR